MTAIITCPKKALMQTMSDVGTLYSSQDLSMPRQCWKQGLSDVGKFLKLSQEICVRSWDMLEVGVSVGLNIAKTKTKEAFHNDIYVIIKEQVNYLV